MRHEVCESLREPQEQIGSHDPFADEFAVLVCGRRIQRGREQGVQPLGLDDGVRGSQKIEVPLALNDKVGVPRKDKCFEDRAITTVLVGDDLL